MDFLRTLVSQQKNRYEENGFNLDLTYITPRTIAMAYPAEGFEALFRNRIEDVARLLDLNHGAKYLVFNASNRAYDESKFFNRVRSMNWPNHYPCPLEHFISMVIEALEFLVADSTHAVIVHCLAGKGRTGSFINALHFAIGQFQSIADANHYYFRKRAVNVTYPSQLRYLDYFVDFCRSGIEHFDFNNKSVERVTISSSSYSFMGDLNHVIRFFDFSRNDFQLAEGFFSSNIRKEDDPARPGEAVYACECFLSPWKDSNSTDILVNLRVTGLLATKALRFNFSMLGVRSDKVIFGLNDVDKGKGLPKDFKLTLTFNRFQLTKEGQARAESLRRLGAQYQEARAKAETVSLRESMFGDEAVKSGGDK